MVESTSQLSECQFFANGTNGHKLLDPTYCYLLLDGHFNIQDVVETHTGTPSLRNGGVVTGVVLSDNSHSVVSAQVMAYYPLHFLSSAIFAPMFIWVERNFNASWNMIAA